MRACVVLVLLAACVGQAEQVLVYDYVGEGEHRIQPVTIPALTDIQRVEGELGRATLGGRLAYNDRVGLTWSQGQGVSVAHVVDDGVFVPLDDQGLVLLSFYHHLAGVRDDIARRGYAADMDVIFPVTTIAWTPEQFTTDSEPVENAAYSSQVNLFILYEDANHRVPLGAHVGVVRHEFGHAWFSVLTADWDDREVPVVPDSRALNEGWADIVSQLTLDDPAAIPFEERNPRLDHNIDLWLESGNPYDLGVVLAAFAWDMRLIIDDPAQTLELVVDALNVFVRVSLQVTEDDPEAEVSSVSFAYPMYDAFATATDDPRLCDAFVQRFPGVEGRCGQ